MVVFLLKTNFSDILLTSKNSKEDLFMAKKTKYEKSGKDLSKRELEELLKEKDSHFNLTDMRDGIQSITKAISPILKDQKIMTSICGRYADGTPRSLIDALRGTYLLEEPKKKKKHPSYQSDFDTLYKKEKKKKKKKKKKQQQVDYYSMLNHGKRDII